MRVLILTAGSHGDVHPLLAVGRRAVELGHHVSFGVNAYFARDVERAGLSFVPLGRYVDISDVFTRAEQYHPWLAYEAAVRTIMEEVPHAVDSLRGAIREHRPDVVISHHACFGARWMSEEQGVPIAMVTLSPLLWFNHRDPIAPLQRGPGRAGAWATRNAGRVLQPVLAGIGGRRLNRLRRTLGYEAERGVFRRDMLGGFVNLGLWSPAFRPGRPDDPPHARVAGFCFYDRGETSDRQLEPALERFVERCDAQGKPPIVFTLGTTAVHSPGAFYAMAADACRRLDWPGVLLVGKGQNRPDDLPDSVASAEYAPLSVLAPRASVIVHHGGVGTVGQTLRAGRPALVLPQSIDQPNNAARVVALGAGLMLHRSKLSTDRLVELLGRLLRERSFAERAGEIGAQIRSEDGPACAMQVVQRELPSADGRSREARPAQTAALSR